MYSLRFKVRSIKLIKLHFTMLTMDMLDKGRRKFIISDSVYYQFCEGIPTASQPQISRWTSNIHHLKLMSK